MLASPDPYFAGRLVPLRSVVVANGGDLFEVFHSFPAIPRHGVLVIICSTNLSTVGDWCWFVVSVLRRCKGGTEANSRDTYSAELAGVSSHPDRLAWVIRKYRERRPARKKHLFWARLNALWSKRCVLYSIPSPFLTLHFPRVNTYYQYIDRPSLLNTNLVLPTTAVLLEESLPAQIHHSGGLTKKIRPPRNSTD